MFDDVQIHDYLKIYTAGADFTGNLVHPHPYNPQNVGSIIRLIAPNGKVIKIRADKVEAVVGL